jgi:hypothetical protein
MNALDREGREAALPPEEPPLWEQLTELFRGRLGWVSVLVAVSGVALTVFTIVSVVYFFRAESTKEMIAWAGGFGLGLIAVSFSRLWFWLLYHRNVVLREVRRVEGQLARLEGRLQPPG